MNPIPTHCPLQDWRIKNSGFNEVNATTVRCKDNSDLDCCYARSLTVSCINDCAEHGRRPLVYDPIEVETNPGFIKGKNGPSVCRCGQKEV